MMDTGADTQWHRRVVRGYLMDRTWYDSASHDTADAVLELSALRSLHTHRHTDKHTYVHLSRLVGGLV